MRPVQRRIKRAIAKAGYGSLPLPHDPFLCLKATRIILEDAFGWPSHALYERVCTERIDGDYKRSPYAADLEKSMRKRGWVAEGATTPIDGDVVFSAQPIPEAHVGLVFTGEGGVLYVIENAMVRRGTPISGANQVTPLSEWDKITTIGRFPPNFPDSEGSVPTYGRNPTTAPTENTEPARRWYPIFDPATNKQIAGEYISVKQRSDGTIRAFKVPLYKLKEEGML